jgi:branched-chain amino acid transport system substrate-binding protein
MLAVLVVLALTGAPAQAQQQLLILGVIQALTGPAAPYGISAREGLELAASEINARDGVLGGRRLYLAVEDSAGDPKRAFNAANHLIERYRAPLIIGPTLSTEMLTVGPVGNERTVPVISSSATAVWITDIGPYVFTTALPASDVIPVQLRTAEQRFDVKTAVLMYGTDDVFTNSEADVFRRELDRLGIKVLATETFRNQDTDFSAQLTRIRELNPDAIAVAAHVEPAAQILMQARQVGLPPSMLVMGGDGFNSPRLVDMAGAAADGVIVGSPWFPGTDDPAAARFIGAYRARYGRDPDQFAARAYDTLYLVATAINLVGNTAGETLRTALMQIRHDGVMGPFWFSPRRNAGSAENVAVLVVKDGRFIALD